MQAGCVKQHQLLAQAYALQACRSFRSTFTESILRVPDLPRIQVEIPHFPAIHPEAIGHEIAQCTFARIEFAKHQKYGLVVQCMHQRLRGLQPGTLFSPASHACPDVTIDGLRLPGKRAVRPQAAVAKAIGVQFPDQPGTPVVHLLQNGLKIAYGRSKPIGRLHKALLAGIHPVSSVRTAASALPAAAISDSTLAICCASSTRSCERSK